jgi:hypothetical protein
MTAIVFALWLLAAHFFAAFAGGGVEPIAESQLAPEVHEGGALVLGAWQWDGPCGTDDVCWVVLTQRDGRTTVTYSDGEVSW